MLHREVETRINRAVLVIMVTAMLWLASCSPVDAESNLITPHLNSQIRTCIYQGSVPPTSDSAVCLPNSQHLADVKITLKDRTGNLYETKTNQNGQIDVAGAAFFSSTDYPSWNLDYSQSVDGYCFAYSAIIADLTNPNWLEYQYSYLPCPSK